MRRAVATLFVVAGLVGCAPIIVDGFTVSGTEWVAISIAGRAPVSGSEPTLLIEDGLLHGFAGCNSYAAQQRSVVQGDRIVVPEILSTAGNCLVSVNGQMQEHPAVALEGPFLGTLRGADRIALRDDRLVLSGPSDELVFERRN